jgi:hypothetical protein
MKIPLLPFVAVLLLLLSSVPAWSQGEGASLMIRVTGDEGREVIPSAIVRIAEPPIGGTTDDRGTVRIEGIPAGARVVQVERIGYAPVRLSLTFAVGATLDTVVDLGARAVDLEEVTVRTRDPELDLPTGGVEGRYSVVFRSQARSQTGNTLIIRGSPGNYTAVWEPGSDGTRLTSRRVTTSGDRMRIELVGPRHSMTFDIRFRGNSFTGNWIAGQNRGGLNGSKVGN